MIIFDQQGLFYCINTSAYSPRASESIPDMYCGYEHFCHAHRDVMITANFSLIYKKKNGKCSDAAGNLWFHILFCLCAIGYEHSHCQSHQSTLLLMGIRETKPRTAKFGCCAHLVPFCRFVLMSILDIQGLKCV